MYFLIIFKGFQSYLNAYVINIYFVFFLKLDDIDLVSRFRDIFVI